MSKILVNKLHTLTGHNDCIYALAEGPDPQFFYTGSGDGMVVEWDLKNPLNGKLIAKVGHSVYALEIDKSRNLLFIGHNFEGIHVIDLVSKKEVWSLKLTDYAIFSIKVFKETLFVGTGDGIIHVIDIKERSFKKHIKLSDKSIRSIAISPKYAHLAVGLSDHSIKILHLEDYTPLYNLTSHSNSVFTLAYAPDESFLISGARDAHIKVWNVSDSYRLEQSIPAHLFAVNFLCFRMDGNYFVSCSMDKSLKVWDSVTRRLLKVIDKARHAGHGTSINKVIWSTYNQTIIAVSDDRSISIWQIEL